MTQESIPATPQSRAFIYTRFFPYGHTGKNETMIGDRPPPGEHEPGCVGGDCMCGRHWTHDVPAGATIEGLAASLIAEAEAVAAMEPASVYVRRGDDGEWREITAAMRRGA